MYSRFLRIFCTILVLGVTLSAYGQLKIAVVNATKAIFDTEAAQQEMETIDNELKGDQERLQGLQDELQALNDRAQKDVDIMSDTEKSELQQQIEDKQLDFQYGYDLLQKRVNSERDRMLTKHGPKFEAVVNDLISIEGYDMVVHWNPQVLLYVNPKHDITRRVTEMLNDRSDEEPDTTAAETSDSEEE